MSIGVQIGSQEAQAKLEKLRDEAFRTFMDAPLTRACITSTGADLSKNETFTLLLSAAFAAGTDAGMSFMAITLAERMFEAREEKKRG